MRTRIALEDVSAAMGHALVQAGGFVSGTAPRPLRRRSDKQALASDWARIGLDLHRAAARVVKSDRAR